VSKPTDSAFPSESHYSTDDRSSTLPYSPGMTTRQYFVAAALTGLVAGSPHWDATPTEEELGRAAVKLADAALQAERVSRPQ
jgi:hypothetical protein